MSTSYLNIVCIMVTIASFIAYFVGIQALSVIISLVSLSIFIYCVLNVWNR